MDVKIWISNIFFYKRIGFQIPSSSKDFDLDLDENCSRDKVQSGFENPRLVGGFSVQI